MKRTVLLAGLTALAAFATLPAEAGNPKRGKPIYERHCAVCHGGDGQPTMPGIPSFYVGERLERPDAVLLKTVREGRRMMPAWRGILNVEEMADVVTYLRVLRR